MKKLALFASGNGSNVQAIIDAIESGRLHAAAVLLVCDKPGAYVIDRAERAGIPAFVFHPKEYSSKEEYESEISGLLDNAGIDYVVLAGYMRLIGPTLLEKYRGRIINIHPSLLPSFPGKDAIGQAVRAGVKVTGVTIHFVDEGMDTGPIIAQRAVEISDGDTLEEVTEKIHKVEHGFYPDTLGKLFSDN
ncbi:MAG TPA: phosphoribosylglycinamide formyltransferase [Bacillaceae bacterium]